MFKLTPATDPKTIMFEGFPEVPIEKIEPVPDAYGRVYVYIGEVPDRRIVFGGYGIRKGNNHSYDVEGTPRATWPRVVPRFVIDYTKPIGVRLINTDGVSAQSELDARGYRVTGRILPVNTDEPELLRLNRTPDKRGYEIDIDPRTGRVPVGTQAGSNLQFFNKTEVKTENRLITYDGAFFSAAVTTVDGAVTHIEWKG